jgi:dihydrofolate reductase
MKVILIAAIDLNGAIGKDNQLLCHLPADLKHFKQLTQGKTVIMGRKTFDSLPGGALPKRRNIVISRQPDLTLANCEVFNSIDSAFAACESEDEVFVIGGAQIYAEALKCADRLYLTLVERDYEGDTSFPEIDYRYWQLVAEQRYERGEEFEYPFSFLTFDRVKL